MRSAEFVIGRRDAALSLLLPERIAMRCRRRFLFGLPLTATMVGCQSVFGEDCLSLAAGPAIAVHVTNAPTGVAPTSGVSLVIRGTAYDSVSTMFVPGSIQAG